MGMNSVNEDIFHSLEDKKSIVDFWWLNNGITILASSARDLGGYIEVDISRPPVGFDPTQNDFVPNIPTGWRDDGSTLTAPNGHRVVLGFRRYVLTHAWDSANVPLQEENARNPLEIARPSLGSGTQQIFNWTTLEWYTNQSVFIGWSGPELLKLRADNANLQAQVASLQAQLQAQKATPPSAPIAPDNQ